MLRSISMPVWAATASAISVVVTEPNSLPSAPARAAMVIVRRHERLGDLLGGGPVGGVLDVAAATHASAWASTPAVALKARPLGTR